MSTETPPRAERAGQDASTVLPLLRDAVDELARSLPGPLHRLSLRAGDCSLEVEFGGAPAVVTAVAAPVAVVPLEEAEAPGTHYVKAPLVGTFYVAPSPGAEPFVRVGDLVEPGQPVGIVEAMKLMNQVTAEAAGRVVQVLAGDGESVEYDQPLLALAPPEA